MGWAGHLCHLWLSLRGHLAAGQPGRALSCEVQGALLKQSLIIVCWHVSTLWCRSQPRKKGVSWGRVPSTSSIHPHQDAASRD